MAWVQLQEKGYSRAMDMNYLVFEALGRIWISPYMQGFDVLSAFLDKKTDELDKLHDENHR